MARIEREVVVKNCNSVLFLSCIEGIYFRLLCTTHEIPCLWSIRTLHDSHFHEGEYVAYVLSLQMYLKIATLLWVKQIDLGMHSKLKEVGDVHPQSNVDHSVKWYTLDKSNSRDRNSIVGFSFHEEHWLSYLLYIFSSVSKWISEIVSSHFYSYNS